MFNESGTFDGLDKLCPNEEVFFEAEDEYGDSVRVSLLADLCWIQTARGEAIILSRENVKALRSSLKELLKDLPKE
jgi:hypothetical protein